MIKNDFNNKLFYVNGAIGSNLVYALVSGFFMFFLTQIQALNSVLVGTIFLFTRLWDAINDPIMGIIIQKTKSKFGRNKPWMFAGAITNFVLIILMFASVNLSGTAKYVYYFSMYILWGMSYTMMDVSYWSMLPNIVSNKDEKAQYSSLGQIGSSIGTFSVTVLFPIALARFFSNSYSGKGYFVIAIIIAVLSLAFMLSCIFCTKETRIVKAEKKFKLKTAFKVLFTNKSFIAITLFYLFVSTAISITTGFGLYYFSFDLGNFSLFSTFALVAGIGQIISVLSYPYVVKKFQQRNIIIFSLIFTMFNYLCMFVTTSAPKVSIPLICIFGFVAMFGLGWLLVYKMIAVTDVINNIYREKKKFYDNMVVSAQTFATKLSSAVSAILIGLILNYTNLTGIDPNTKTQVTLSLGKLYVMRVFMFVVPILLLGLALICYLSLYKLDKKENLLREKFVLEKQVLSDFTSENQPEIENRNTKRFSNRNKSKK